MIGKVRSWGWARPGRMIRPSEDAVVNSLCMFLTNTMEQVITTPIALASSDQPGDVVGKR